MTPPRSRLDDALRRLGDAPAPPPSPTLNALVNEAGPVPRRRRPGRTLALVLLASFFALALHVHSHGIRQDFEWLPKWWFWSMALGWLAAFVAPLAIVFVPRRGSMFVDSATARVASLAIPVLAIILELFLRVDVPPATVIPDTAATALANIEACLVTGLEMSAIPFALGVLALRRAPQPLGTRWIGAALGAANGTLAALMLHVNCRIGGALHTGVAHAGQVVLGALLGAILVPMLTKWPRE
jgi:Negative regulator of sigma F